MRRQEHNIKAIIYNKRGRILSVGQNSYIKTHPLQARLAARHNKPDSIYLHAEIDAIIKCRDLTKAYKIFVSRVKANGQYGLAKPCPICQDAIKQAGIEVVEYTI